MGRRGRGVCAGLGRQAGETRRPMRVKYSTCGLNADPQYFRDRLRGGWGGDCFYDNYAIFRLD